MGRVGQCGWQQGLVQERRCWVAVFVDGLVPASTFIEDIDEGRAAAERLAHERPMAEEDATPDVVEMMRRMGEAANRGDRDAHVGFFVADGVLQTGVGRFDGREAIRDYVEDFWRSYDELSVAEDELHDLGNGVALFSSALTGRLRGSNAEVHLRWAGVITHARGLVSRWTDYVIIDEARAAAERLAQERG
jgi:hypothetical protein